MISTFLSKTISVSEPPPVLDKLNPVVSAAVCTSITPRIPLAFLAPIKIPCEVEPAEPSKDNLVDGLVVPIPTFLLLLICKAGPKFTLN